MNEIHQLSNNNYSLLMRGIKLESLAKLIFECKTLIHIWVYMFAIKVLFLYKKALS